MSVQRCDAYGGWRAMLAERPVDWSAGRGLFVCTADGRDCDGVYVCDSAAVRLYDIERREAVWRAPWVSETDGGVPYEQMSMLGAGAAGGAAARGFGLPLASYSRGWRLLAAIDDAGGIALWDTRTPSGPTARVRLPCGEAAGAVHLDAGGGGWSGALHAAARESGAIHLFDIRRVRAGSAVSGVLAVAPCPERRRGCGACFAVGAQMLVVGGGAKAHLWRVGVDSAAEPQSRADDEAAGEALAGGARKPKKKHAPKKDHSRASRPQ